MKFSRRYKIQFSNFPDENFPKALPNLLLPQASKFFQHQPNDINTSREDNPHKSK